MMFSIKPTVMYLTSKKVIYFNGKTRSEIEWDGHDFDSFFKALKGKIKALSVRIVLGYEQSYVLTLLMPKTAKPEEIIAKANELVPEEANAQNTVYSVRGENEGGESIIQVFTIANSIFQGISESAVKNNINIEYLCPIPSIIASSLPEKEKAVLVTWSGEENLALIINKGVIYGSEEISEDAQKKVVELADYIKNRFGFRPSLVYTNQKTKNASGLGEIEVKEITLDLFAFVSAHTLSENGQNELLTIKANHEKEQPETAKNPVAESVTPANANSLESGTETKVKGNTSIFWTIILFLLIFGAIGFFAYQFFFKK